MDAHRPFCELCEGEPEIPAGQVGRESFLFIRVSTACLLYTSDAADEMD